MLLMIDNFDSFTYILLRYFKELGQKTTVFRNNAITLEEIQRLNPDYIVISPGPCTPNEAGISLEVIKHFAGKIPLLGVCLGHQALGQAFGSKVVRAPCLMHGKTSLIYHDGKTIFSGLPQGFTATRYHSLILERKTLSPCFTVSARTDRDEIMAIRHKDLPLEGVQFHPESILTQFGHRILNNFLTAYRNCKHVRRSKFCTP
ncbi:MAG: aminodeoxychorismate/anthranilate synthase component II [Dethiobacter sp.]|jgi:anthranilate synthase/aminodeoxychorismate synthase-like glutamine amidotransferase|nr:MAG: aminodeoxychorismate/anthranilate synthase component II [Dethiobacter sp.]